MLRTLRSNLFRLTTLPTNPMDRQRALGLFWVSWGFFALGALTTPLMLLLLLRVSAGALLLGFVESVYLLVQPPSFLLAGILLQVFVRRGRYTLAASVFVLFLFSFSVPLYVNGLYTAVVALLALPLMAAALLLNRGGVLLTAGAVAVMVVFGYLRQSAAAQDVVVIFPAEQALGDFGLVAAGVLLASTLLLLFTSNLNTLVRESLAETDQLQWLNGFSRELANVPDEASTLRRALDVLRQRFNYTFAQIYLSDDQGALSSRASTLLGVQENTAAYTLVDSSAIAGAARTKQYVLTSLTDLPTRRTHFLASTRASIAIPLIAGETVIGVLDVQSDRFRPFSRSTIGILTLLGTEIANTILDLRRLQSMRTSFTEQQTISANLRAQLATRDEQSRQGVSAAWDEYLKQRGREAFGYDLRANNEPQEATDLPAVLKPTLQTGALAVTPAGDEQLISVPIRFGDQTLGAMSFAVPADRPLTQREIELAQSVSDRLALALDNARLLEQTRAQAFRESKATELGSTLLTVGDVTTLLDIAAEQFNQALGSIYTRIVLQPGVLEGEPDAGTNGTGAHTGTNGSGAAS